MKTNGPEHPTIDRRAVLKGATALAGSTALGTRRLPEEASAQDASTLVIACPATPQGLDIEFDVSLGSIDTLGCIYDYMVAYEKIPDPNAPDVLREDTSRAHRQALQHRAGAEARGILGDDGRRAARRRSSCARASRATGATSSPPRMSSGPGTASTWPRARASSRPPCSGSKSPDQVKIEGKYAISFNLEKPNPLLLKQHRNLANPIYDATKCKEAGGTDDPLAIKFLQNEVGRLRPLPAEPNGPRPAGGVHGARRLLGREAVHEDGHHARSADLGRAPVAAAGRRGRHRPVPAAARVHQHQG